MRSEVVPETRQCSNCATKVRPKKPLISSRYGTASGAGVPWHRACLSDSQGRARRPGSGKIPPFEPTRRDEVALDCSLMSDTVPPTPAYVFKILLEDEWRTCESTGEFSGSPDDERDGFVHLSTEDQVEGTLNKYFPSERRVIIARVATLGLDVRMEVSRGGAAFPHLYAPLRRSAVESVVVRELTPT